MTARRLSLACLMLAFSLLGGCPSDDTASGTISEAQATAPGTAEVGQFVTLAATLSGDGDLSSAKYEWFQTYGPLVHLSDPAAAEPSFTAPSLGYEATLRFRVDVTLSGRMSSAEVSVVVYPDANFGLDTGGGGSNDNDPFPQVRLTTSKGEIVLELNRSAAPISVNNFLRYVDDDFYNGTIFHRVIPDFVVQGGGFTADLTQKETRNPIKNEATNGLKNVRGSLAMARTDAADSATAQFYVNLVDNTSLDHRDGFVGYAVFGRVIVGMDVVDKIAEVETQTEKGFSDVPVQDVILQKAERASGVQAEG